MTAPEPDPDALAAHAQAVSARALEIEIELRETRAFWAPLLCSCHRNHPSECQIHGLPPLWLADGRWA
jgi:hypothetical protein